MGRWSTVVGMLVSIGTAYLVMNAASIMDYVQALFSFFIAPLFGTVILGMLWKRATKGAASGAARRDGSSIGMFMAENMFRALWSWLICVASPSS
jgi:SSS family solute:Na+ symporter